MTRIRLIVLLLLLSGFVIAQERQESVDSVATDYLRAVENFSLLYNGNEQEMYPRITNHPYLIDNLYTKARLSYRNIIYPEVLLRLDLHRNELLVQSPSFRNIVLFPEDVDFAVMYGKQIIYFKPDHLPGCPSTGYYILLYSGGCKIFEKRIAQMMEKTSPGLLERYFDYSTRYYLFKDGIYYSIKNKRGLLKALYPFKKEIKRFISSQKLNFRDDAEEFLILTVNEYEKLSGI